MENEDQYIMTVNIKKLNRTVVIVVLIAFSIGFILGTSI